MAVNKYLGPTGLTELINLIQADFQKKQDWVQFPEMPAAAEYVGKVVQYTGITNDTYTKGFFYYSTGLEWVGISVASAVEIVDALPAYDAADPKIIYMVVSDDDIVTGYIKDANITGKFYQIGGGSVKGFELVVTLPSYADADPDVLYLVPDDAGLLSAYKKDPDTAGEFFELSGNDAITMEDIENIFNEVFG